MKQSPFKVMKVDVSSFILTPAHVVFTPDIPTLPFQEFKHFFTDLFLMKGIGTIVTTFSIRHEFQFEDKLIEKRTSLLNSPVDFVLGLKIPAEKLTISLIRKCRSAKIPAIFIKFDKASELDSIPWGWIRNAAFPYNPVLIPIYPPATKVFSRNRNSKKWATVLKNEKMQHLPKPLSEDRPLSVDELKKIGLYPIKGILRAGGEISYNLYLKDSQFDHRKALDYDSVRPSVVIQKGQFAVTGEKVTFRPGYGEELIINQTALFV